MRLNHVTIHVGDLDRSIAFYRRLGFRPLVASEGYARFQCPQGDSTLSLESRGGAAGAPAAITIHFESDRLDELVSELKAAGIEFEQDPTDQPYLWREAILRDPDGHRLFLYHAGVNRLNPPWRLPPQDPPPSFR
jgi:catechol 2,3-dioxygenase-like lactoylglutathione lyase family enzyme